MGGVKPELSANTNQVLSKLSDISLQIQRLLQTQCKCSAKPLQDLKDSHKVMNIEITPNYIHPQPTLINTFDFGKYGDKKHTTVIRSLDGSVFVGGYDKKLNKLDSDLKLVSSVDLGDIVNCGITVNKLIVCGMASSNSLRVFDNSLKLIKEIKL